MSALTMSGERPQQIVDGLKTVTCRPVKPGDMFRQANAAMMLEDAVIAASGVIKWRVGGIVPVKPGRIQPTCLVEDRDSEVVRDLLRTCQRLHPRVDFERDTPKLLRDYLLCTHDGFSLLYVKVTALARVDVREMTHDEAIAEGFTDAYSYLEWWTKAYDSKAFTVRNRGTKSQWHSWLKTRPAERYDAWQLRFQRHVQP
jgi:hypothetical protein